MKKAVINKSIVFQKIDNKLVGFDIDKSALYTFNETAECIYKRVKAGANEAKIARQLSKKYDIDEKVALKDVVMLVKELKKNGVLLRGKQGTIAILQSSLHQGCSQDSQRN